MKKNNPPKAITLDDIHADLVDIKESNEDIYSALLAILAEIMAGQKEGVTMADNFHLDHARDNSHAAYNRFIAPYKDAKDR